ncbi:hypothetical protein EC957_004061 [Mortierella hygrophila]|uniref:Uncharacterized protein n=1 Tax=Mortierella hygrophila TaxID=979708 RepID=A0A9P6F1V1_9FUNG|nr:hypothetical protein EC957_004061 [Mortierella hygrophila]
MLVDLRCSKAAHLCRETVEALWEHCYYLDAIDGEYEMCAGWRRHQSDDHVETQPYTHLGHHVHQYRHEVYIEPVV